MIERTLPMKNRVCQITAFLKYLILFVSFSQASFKFFKEHSDATDLVSVSSSGNDVSIIDCGAVFDSLRSSAP